MATAEYTFENAYIRANCAPKDKIEAIERWMELGNDMEKLIFINTLTANTYRVDDNKISDIVKFCRDSHYQLIEIISIEKYDEEETKDND